jgi:deoxyribose-phosphate aldolase
LSGAAGKNVEQSILMIFVYLSAPAARNKRIHSASPSAFAVPNCMILEGIIVTEKGSSQESINRMIDHTLLKADASESQIRQLCKEAVEYQFCTVCVNPYYVKLCSQLLAGTGVLVCTVVGFPLGATLTDVKDFEAQLALGNGANEIDMVINIGALKSGDRETVQQDIEMVANTCHDGGAILKVIIEAALLTDDEKEVACRLAVDAGADFVKTSTGFGPGGATVEDVALMRRTVGPDIGVKAAGGIRTFAQAQQMIAAGATRIGASAGVKIVEETK